MASLVRVGPEMEIGQPMYRYPSLADRTPDCKAKKPATGRLVAGCYWSFPACLVLFHCGELARRPLPCQRHSSIPARPVSTQTGFPKPWAEQTRDHIPLALTRQQMPSTPNKRILMKGAGVAHVSEVSIERHCAKQDGQEPRHNHYDVFRLHLAFPFRA